MISIFASPTIVATSFCAVGWGYLVYKNVQDRRLIFALACFISSVAYLIGVKQYIDVFYIYRTPQPAQALWLLFIRLLLHCTTVLIFVYNYGYSLSKDGSGN